MPRSLSTRSRRFLKSSMSAIKTCGADCTCIPLKQPKSGPVEVPLKETQWICVCGQSSKYPYCDGSHNAYNKEHGTKLGPWKADPKELNKESVWICQCGHSKGRKEGKPLCDGTHAKLVDLEKQELKKQAAHQKSCGPDCTCIPMKAPTYTGPVEVLLTETKWICVCGQSANFPYCDGSHNAYNKEHGTKIGPWKSDPKELNETSIWVCKCGHSKGRKEGKPLCDGTHTKLVDLEVNPKMVCGGDCTCIQMKNPGKGPKQVELKETQWICMCGQSNKYPYCDGSHNAYNKEHGTKLGPWKADSKELNKSSIWVCGCGHSKQRASGKPLCDGTHAKLVDMEQNVFS